METLVLNSLYMPIDRISWTDAITDILTGRAEVVETYADRFVRSGYRETDVPGAIEALRTDEKNVWKVPSIIRFVGKAIFRKRYVKFNRHNVWLRDQGRCQFCNSRVRMSEFTYDHVVPQSKGGRTCWTNIVVCCHPCNQRKANRMASEVGMKLQREPFQPMTLPGQVSPVLQWKDGMPDSWKSFLASVSYWHGSLD